MSQSTGERTDQEDDEDDELNYTQEELEILHNLGFDDDFLEILSMNGITSEAILNDYLIVLALPLDEGGFNNEIDNVEDAINDLDEETKHQIADTVLGRLGPQGGGKRKRNKRKTNKRKSKKRRTNKRKSKKRRTNKRR